MNTTQITEAVNHYWSLAKKEYPSLGNMPAPNIEFYTTGKVAGKAWRSTNQVAFNVTLARQEGERFRDTISHEVAHRVQFTLNPLCKQPHGTLFKSIHRALGGSGTTYHNYDTLMVKKHRKGSQVFVCGCEGRRFALTPQRSVLGFAGCLTCRVCNQKLKHLGSVEQIKLDFMQQNAV